MCYNVYNDRSWSGMAIFLVQHFNHTLVIFRQLLIFFRLPDATWKSPVWSKCCKNKNYTRGQELFVKEALHGQMTPSEEYFNKDWVLVVDYCDEEAGREEQSSLTFDLQWHVPSIVHGSACSHFFTFTLTTTGALSRNVGKLFFELKLVTDYLPLHLELGL